VNTATRLPRIALLIGPGRVAGAGVRRPDSLDRTTSPEGWHKFSVKNAKNTIDGFRDRLLYEAQVRGESFNLIVRQFAGNADHRRTSGGVITLIPLLQAPSQIGRIKSAQAGNISDAFAIRTMANDAGHDVRFRHSLLVNCLPEPDEARHAVTGGSRRQTCKI
jgi:hypothetical protein